MRNSNLVHDVGVTNWALLSEPAAMPTNPGYVRQNQPGFRNILNDLRDNRIALLC
jgi:hypothetical protein